MQKIQIKNSIHSVGDDVTDWEYYDIEKGSFIIFDIDTIDSSHIKEPVTCITCMKKDGRLFFMSKSEFTDPKIGNIYDRYEIRFFSNTHCQYRMSYELSESPNVKDFMNSIDCSNRKRDFLLTLLTQD